MANPIEDLPSVVSAFLTEKPIEAAAAMAVFMVVVVVFSLWRMGAKRGDRATHDKDTSAAAAEVTATVAPGPSLESR